VLADVRTNLPIRPTQSRLTGSASSGFGPGSWDWTGSWDWSRSPAC